MRSERVTPEHRCKPDRLRYCWHVDVRLPDGGAATFAVRDDGSFGAHTTVSFEHPGVEILAVAFGRTAAPEQK
jgi:hypothetical protein